MCQYNNIFIVSSKIIIKTPQSQVVKANRQLLLLVLSGKAANRADSEQLRGKNPCGVFCWVGFDLVFEQV